MPLLREGQEAYVYHAELMIGEQRIIMSDQVDMEIQPCYANFLTVMCDTKEQVQAACVLFKLRIEN